jgi:hypothetical protein
MGFFAYPPYLIDQVEIRPPNSPFNNGRFAQPQDWLGH